MTTIKSSQIHHLHKTSYTFMTVTITAVQHCFSRNDNYICLTFISVENSLFQVWVTFGWWLFRWQKTVCQAFAGLDRWAWCFVFILVNL